VFAVAEFAAGGLAVPVEAELPEVVEPGLLEPFEFVLLGPLEELGAEFCAGDD